MSRTQGWSLGVESNLQLTAGKELWCSARRGASQVALVVETPPGDAGDLRGGGSIPESGRSPAGGHGNPLQYSCLENPMDRGAWGATVHGVSKSRT